MLFPIQIALLEMVIDPACSVVFEAEGEESDVMQRQPRSPSTSVLPRNAALWAASQGLMALAIVAAALFWGSRLGMPEEQLRALVFTVLVLMNISLILVNRSFRSSLPEALLRPNRTLWFLVSAALLVLSAALYWPPAQKLFNFGPLSLGDLFGCLTGGVILIAALEGAKAFRSLED
jgi:Ca2+-transporting ATPase